MDAVRPRELGEVLALLSGFGGDARVLGGGRSLRPLLNPCLVRPRVLVNISPVPGLAYVPPGASAAALVLILAIARRTTGRPLRELAR